MVRFIHHMLFSLIPETTTSTGTPMGKRGVRGDGRLPVVSVGGIMSPEDARRRLDMRAALVQVHTGLV